MNVAFVPFYKSNPFQKILIQNLSEEIDCVGLDDVEPRYLALEVIDKDLDVLHLHWADFFYRESYAKTLAKFCILHFNLLALSIFGPDIVWTMHNDRDHENKYPALDYINRFLIALFADKVTVWDSNTKKIASERFYIKKGKIEIIPHGNYLPVIEQHEIPSKREARNKLGIPSGYEQVYLFVGLIRPYKQVPELIDVFEKISEDSDLLIIAGNPYNKEIEDKLNSKIEGLENVMSNFNYLSETALIEYYKACDWAVFPYKHIFNSGSIFYAMSLSTPFIAPNQGSINSFKQTDNIVYNGSIQNALEESRDIGDTPNLGEKNRKLMEDEYSWQKIRERFTEIYD